MRGEGMGGGGGEGSRNETKQQNPQKDYMEQPKLLGLVHGDRPNHTFIYKLPSVGSGPAARSPL